MLKLQTAQEQNPVLTESWSSFLQQQQQAEVSTVAIPPTQAPQGGQQQQQQAPPVDDPFKDIPMDNLDDTTKAALEKIKLGYAEKAKNESTLTERLARVENQARQFQSVADRAITKLKHHGLAGDPQQTQQTPEEQQEALLEAGFVKNGMNEATAKQYAKIFQIGMNTLKPGLLGEVGGVLGPALGKLNSMAADRFLEAHSANPNTQVALQIPGVREATKGIIDTMIQNRQDITEGSVSAAVQMAVGEALMKSGGDITKLKATLNTPPQNQQASILQSLFGGNITGGGNFHVSPNGGAGNGNNTGAPVAANEDTAKAAATLAALMDRQIKKS